MNVGSLSPPQDTNKKGVVLTIIFLYLCAETNTISRCRSIVYLLSPYLWPPVLQYVHLFVNLFQQRLIFARDFRVARK